MPGGATAERLPASVLAKALGGYHFNFTFTRTTEEDRGRC